MNKKDLKVGDKIWVRWCGVDAYKATVIDVSGGRVLYKLNSWDVRYELGEHEWWMPRTTLWDRIMNKLNAH